MTVGGRSVRITQQPDPALLDRTAAGVDVVIEATGRFRTREKAAAHLAAGARKVVLTWPGTGVDATVVMGTNQEVYSCTSDQNLLDGPHTDLRRARSAAVTIIPTTTGAAKAIGQVLPRLAGRLDGIAVRVPVVDAASCLVDSEPTRVVGSSSGTRTA